MKEPSAPPVRPRPEDKSDYESPLQHFFKAAGYSLSGLGTALKNELAFRMEVVAFFVLLPFAILIPVSPLLRLMIIGSMLIVMAAELLNSAMERTVDYISLDLHPLAKRAKDMGSAGVMLTLINSGLLWAFAVAVWLGWVPLG